MRWLVGSAASAGPEPCWGAEKQERDRAPAADFCASPAAGDAGRVQSIVQPSSLQMLSHQSFPPHLLLVLQRCEKWFCWQVWRGRPTADEPRASLTHPLLMCPCHALPVWVTAVPCRSVPRKGRDWSSSSGPAAGLHWGPGPALVSVPSRLCQHEMGRALPLGTGLRTARGIGSSCDCVGWGGPVPLLQPGEKPWVIFRRDRFAVQQ